LVAYVARSRCVMGQILEAAREAADSPHASPNHRHAAELRRLIAQILSDDTQAERDWTLSIALTDVENALISLRALAEGGYGLDQPWRYRR